MKSSFKDCEVRRMSLTEMNPAEYNPRKISDHAAEGLGKSIDEFGMMVPIVWNERSGNIIGGHQRYDRLREKGETETDVVVVDLDDNEEVALNIALNSKTIRGDFTKEVVGLLELSEAQLGNAFNDIGLLDLHNFVKRLKFEIPEGDSGSGDGDRGNGDGDGDNDGGKDGDMPSGPDAIISCPKCRSRWKMKDKSVVYNATRGGAS